jgi:hypothetical protein
VEETLYVLKYARVFFKFFSSFKLKVCGREFFELLKVSMLNFEVCGREVFKLLKVSNFKCVKEGSLPLLQISNEISTLCKKKIQVFEGFLLKVLFCNI